MRQKSIFAVFGLLLLTAGVAAVRGLDATEETPHEIVSSARLVPVEVVEIKPVNEFEQQRTYTGTVVARRRSDLAFERAAELVVIEVDEGDVVTAGQVLASLDLRRLNVQRGLLEAQKAEAEALLLELKNGPREQTIAAARAEVRNLVAQRNLRKRNLTRDESLHQQNAVTRQQLDASELSFESFDAQVAAAEQRLEELVEGTREERIAAQEAVVRRLNASIEDVDVSIEDSTLLAPFAGRIARRYVDEGAVVAVGSPIFEIIETSALEARIALPVSTASRIDQQVEHQVIIGGEAYQSKVRSILPDVDLATRTRMVVYQLEERASEKVVSGEIARVEVTEPLSTSGFWLPQTALTRGTHGLWSAYAVVADDAAQEVVERRDVEIVYTQSERVLARGTLEEGDRIVMGGLHRIVPGQTVSPSLVTTGE
ncbi:MAG: efflux RND transporter periplasmic adaptor subunit [Planctomycetaceae bacterium]|nr:efflux RND transporter periplasmic adaptor subunit [Planctomycetaceae bacterium]